MQDKESKKTLTFVLVAGIALLMAWEPWRPAPIDTSAPVERGQKLFPDFKDPLVAKSLEVVQFDEKTAAIRDFKVAQANGVWSIPSHSNYPADAQQHMADAATALMGVKILSMASDRQGDREEFGVITPDPATLKVGMRGVGTRVTVRDAADKPLADLVVGKAVKDQIGQYYVRKADRDQIFTVQLQPDKFSTRFGDWIEKDLLKLNAFDVKNLELNDYSTQTGVNRQGQRALGIDQRSVVKLDFDDAKSQWSLVEMAEFDRGQAKPVTLKEDEELDSEKLNALKSALDDLQIVDVERKPGGLSRDLRANEEFLNNVEALRSLEERGFIPAARSADSPPEIFSSEGEVTCTTKDGVKYVLRFGNLAGGSTEGETTEGEEPKSNAPNRYLFVMAQFDENQIPKPQLEAMPGEEKPTEEKPTEEEPAEEARPEEKPTAESVPETKTAFQEEPAQQAEPAADAKPEEKAETKPAEKEPATPEEQKKIAVERENKRRQDEYDAAIKKGQDKVKELNDRFADWYFIISDDTYKKIHLGGADIIKRKETPESEKGQGINELKKFEGGLGAPPTP